LRESFETIKAAGASLVAIAPDTIEGLQKFTGKESFPFPVSADADGSVFEAYDVTSRLVSLGQQPAMFIVDQDGKVTFDAIGAQQWDLISPKQLVEELKKATR
jgi:peroxiredoxin